MNIRIATPRDAAGIASVQVLTWRAAYKDLMADTVLDGMTVEKRTERWTNILEDATERGTRGPTVVAVDHDGEVIGFCSGGTNRDKLSEQIGEVYALYVLKEHWGSGLGARLLEAFVDIILEHYDDLVLWVLADNDRAIAFYKKSGFEPDGATKTIKSGDDRLPEIRMRRTATASLDEGS